MHELLYPLMQAYDSVVLQADIELGGSDQLFNLLMGRHLMRQMGLSPQCVLTLPLLEGTDARTQNGQIVGQKMSKSLGNAIGLTAPPNDQFGKILSINDDLMWRYFNLLSLRDPQEIGQLKQQHPKQAKMQLAHEIVSRFHNPQAADQAQQHFNTLFGAGNRTHIPTDTPTMQLQLPPQNSSMPLIQMLHNSKLTPSKAEAKRLIRQGAVVINGHPIHDLQHTLPPGHYEIRAGKTRWARVQLSPPTNS